MKKTTRKKTKTSAPALVRVSVISYIISFLFIGFVAATVYSVWSHNQEKVLSENDVCLDVPILVYHHVSPVAEAKAGGYSAINVDPTTFKTHLETMKANGYSFITLDQLYNALHDGTPIPLKSAVLTIDDGYRDTYTNALPILKGLNIQASLAITPYQIGRTKVFMTWTQLAEMKQSGLVSIYSHSYRHAQLTAMTKVQMSKDIDMAETALKGKNLFDGKYFIYPGGQQNNTLISVLKGKSYTMAFVAKGTSNQCLSNIMKLNRKMIGNNKDITTYGISL